MPQIPFPFSSAPGARPQEGSGRIINGYAEKLPPGGPSQVKWNVSPGLRQLVEISSHSHLRAAIDVSGTLVVCMDSRAYSITKSGSVYTATNLGAMAGTDRMTVARNNAATPNIVAVGENGAKNLFTGSAPTDFADTDLPQPNSVSFLDGYFLFTIGDARIFASDLNSVSVSALSYTTAQGRTDGLLRGVAYRKEFFAFGQASCEVYRNVGTSPFPLEFVTMIPRGIIGTHAIAGWEQGWSNELIWVGDDNKVYKLSGYTPAPISTRDVERSIASASDRSALEADVYVVSGNSFWTLTSPGEWTWEYNLTTGEWNERKSHDAEAWRGSCTVRAFEEWVVGDRSTGLIFAIDEDYRREASDPLAFEITSGVLHNFPLRHSAPRADFFFTSAVGMSGGEDPVQTDPSVAISWSLDGGYSYGSPVIRKLGAEGEANQQVSVTRLGLAKARGLRFKLRVSDPVHVSLMGGTVAAEQRAE